MKTAFPRWLASMAALLALPLVGAAAQLSITPSYPVYGDNVSVELRDTEWPSYLQATRYSRNGWNISIEYEYAAAVPVKGRADFGNAVLTLGELVPGTYQIEARLFQMDDPSVAARVVKQQMFVAPPARWGVYLIPREPQAFVPTDVLVSSAVYFEPGSMRATVSGNVVRVDFAYIGNAGVGGRIPPGTAAVAAVRLPALAPGHYVVEGWGQDKRGFAPERYFVQEFTVSAVVPVIEYYSETLDHYVMRASPAEIALLDSGAAGGWKRTGQQFNAWLRMGDGPSSAQPICGFVGEGARSTFYTGVAGECAWLKALEIEQRAGADAAGGAFAGWTYESVAFYALLPEEGKCAAGTTAVYRSYNDRGGAGDANHRFITDPRQRSAMAMSWLDEGPAFCSPD